ncbi:MAG TPA: type II toxin-antitoxin system VapC family toxin [Candidatus Limnocylindrales bacterium]|nr:type II toxin-antitoxin system VapC family toxin [Candidatus Limnocylindrales bacterium]
MRFLIDTHIWLWAALEPHKLTSEVHRLLNSPGTDLFLFPTSLWEVSVLIEKKRFTLKEDFSLWVQKSASDLKLQEIDLDWRVAYELRFILPNHKDPADRFLAPTAVAYDMTLVTADQKLIGVPVLKVLANV